MPGRARRAVAVSDTVIYALSSSNPPDQNRLQSHARQGWSGAEFRLLGKTIFWANEKELWVKHLRLISRRSTDCLHEGDDSLDAAEVLLGARTKSSRQTVAKMGSNPATRNAGA
jgi:hypothetical protein